MRRLVREAVCVVIVAVVGCGSSDDEKQTRPAPAGSCKTNGTATGSFGQACTSCGAAQCDAELSDKAGSGWQSGYWGGDGACAAFNGCTCGCLGSGKDPIACATTACIADMTPACQAAAQKAQDCLDAKCADLCR